MESGNAAAAIPVNTSPSQKTEFVPPTNNSSRMLYTSNKPPTATAKVLNDFVANEPIEKFTDGKFNDKDE